MKFFHLGDLHIGKVVNRFSMLDDQRHALSQVLAYVRQEKPDAVVIAGDVYDKPMPTTEAVQLFDDFLTGLAGLDVCVMLISGNHDSAERLSFAGRLLRERNVHIYSLFDGTPHTVTLKDTHGACHFHLLPFIKPAHVRGYFPGREINSYGTAMEAVLSAKDIDASTRNVLVAHQFVTAPGSDPERSDSEVEPVGGLDGISTALFGAFDYVALGHLHGPQRIGRDSVRYAGSLLKYSFSECFHQKGIASVEMGKKGDLQITRLPLSPLRDMRKIRGPVAELTSPEVVASGNPEDYLHVTLTDPHEIIDAMGKLRAVYPHVMELAFDNARTRAQSSFTQAALVENRSPLELFSDFYEGQNGEPPTAGQMQVLSAIMKAVEDMP